MAASCHWFLTSLTNQTSSRDIVYDVITVETLATNFTDLQIIWQTI